MSDSSISSKNETRWSVMLWRSLDRLHRAVKDCARIGFQESSPTTNASHAEVWNYLNEAQKDAALKLDAYSKLSGDSPSAPETKAPREEKFVAYAEPTSMSWCNHGRMIHAYWACSECGERGSAEETGKDVRTVNYNHPDGSRTELHMLGDVLVPDAEKASDEEDSYIHGPGTFPHSEGCRCERCSPPKAPEDRRPTGQCSWGCYYNAENKLVRDPACTVHGAS